MEDVKEKESFPHFSFSNIHQYLRVADSNQKSVNKTGCHVPTQNTERWQRWQRIFTQMTLSHFSQLSQWKDKFCSSRIWRVRLLFLFIVIFILISPLSPLLPIFAVVWILFPSTEIIVLLDQTYYHCSLNRVPIKSILMGNFCNIIMLLEMFL